MLGALFPLLVTPLSLSSTPPPPWSQLFGLTGFPGNLPASNFSVSLGRVATGGENVTGRVVEQGPAHLGMMQAQGLSAFDSSRGVLLALLENGMFMPGHQVHLVSWSAKTGAVIDSCVAPMLPDQYVGAGQYLAVDESENRALMIGRDKIYGAGQAWLWTLNLDGNNCSASTAQKLGAALPVAPDVNLAFSFSALDQAAGVFWAQLPLAEEGGGDDIVSPQVVGFDSHTGQLLHKLKLSGPGLQNPTFMAYDSGRGRVVGLGVSFDLNTHARTGSELFALDSQGGRAVTIRKNPLPDSVVNVLSAVGTVDAGRRLLYFTCYINTGNGTTSRARNDHGDDRTNKPALTPGASGVVQHRNRVDAASNGGTSTIAITRGGKVYRGGETIATGLCAVNVDSGAFLFSESVCTDQPKCPWSLQYWN